MRTCALQVLFAGEEVDDIHVVVPNIVPQASASAAARTRRMTTSSWSRVQISCLSYAGKLSVSFVVDEDVVKDPHKLAGTAAGAACPVTPESLPAPRTQSAWRLSSPS
jgi:hypothetical protein